MRKKDMQSACGEREHGEDADRTLRRMGVSGAARRGWRGRVLEVRVVL